jgi:two-component system LytT family sensor kinase
VPSLVKRVSSSDDKNQIDSPRSSWALGVIGVWLVLSLISASQRYADSLQTSSPASFPETLFWSLVIWSYWALATPFIFRLGERLPLVKERLGFAVPAHFIFSNLLGLLHVALLALLGALVGSGNTGVPVTFFSGFSRGVRAYLYLELILYWAILGACIARDSYRKYREREIMARELETQLSLARLEALKMQVHPHFLFNALNTVSMLIRNNETSQAVEMVAGLGELLRSSLSGSSEQEVPLESELNFVRKYLSIEEFRFPDRLRVEVDVPDELLTAEVPNLILQPLVENAIRHGVAKSSSSGHISIIARRQNGWLELSVVDDGPGLPAGRGLDSGGHGIGLKNVRSRLEQLYGSQQEFVIESTKPKGAVARLRIPFHRRDRE